MSEPIQILFDPVQRMICPFCHARMDVSTIAPFNKAICPSCSSEVTVPARLGAFLLTELLGTGGMGGVYRAHDETLGRDVAIKVMLKSLGDSPEFVTSFRREAQAAAKLNHPNIAQIYSFGQEKGQPYIVMELVPGMHFDQMITAPDPLDIPMVMKIGNDIAEGLQMAAEANLIHGDIKPENILLDERNQAKLVDFGIAAKPSKGENEIWGTPYYIAPERVRRQRVDFRSDIYCLGGTLYHAITQHPPFDGADALEVVRARLQRPPEPLETYRPEVDPEVSAIIMRMLQAEPAMRYPTYGSLLSDMRKYLARVQPRAPASPSGRRIVIKGRKAATAALSTPGATRQMPAPNATGRNTGPIGSRTRPMVITRGMFPDPVLPQGPATAPDADGQSPGASWGKRILVAVLILVGLSVAGGVSAWVIHWRNQKAKAGRLEAEHVGISRRQAEMTTLHGTILKGVETIASLETQAGVLVTQAVALVEQDLGDTYSARIVEEPPEPAIPEGGIDLPETNAVAEAETGAAAAAPGGAMETGTVAVAAAPGGVTATGTVATASETGGETPADGGSAVEAVALEPLPPLAQMARDVHQQALPLKTALRLARRLEAQAGTLLDSAHAATNTLDTQETARQQLVALAANIEGEQVRAAQTLAAAREKLGALVRESQRLASERRQAEAEARRLAAEQQAAEDEARRQAEQREAVRAEVMRVVTAVETQKESLLKHQYAKVLRELRALEGELRHEEGRQALALAVRRVTCLQSLREFMIKRLNEVPYKDNVGWSVEKAGPRALTLRTAAGAVNEVPWESVNNRAMAGFIKFYIHDEQQAKALKLRERHAQTINAIVYTLTFGEGTDDARAMIRTLGQRAVDMLPSERAETLRLLPELTTLID